MQEQPFPVKWEPISTDHPRSERLWAPSGWLVRSWLDSSHGSAIAIVFVPDSSHEWILAADDIAEDINHD